MRRATSQRSMWLLAAGFLACGSMLLPMRSGRAADDFFSRQVAPILTARCLECHDTGTAEGKLDLSRRETALRGGESGPPLNRTDWRRSLLWKRIRDDEMPPERPLPAAEKKVLREWLRRGAAWSRQPLSRFGRTTSKRAGLDWWSLQPLNRGNPPAVPADRWSQNPIDRFVLARLRKAGLSPARRAAPRTLVRRLYFDLVGLPPTWRAVQAFEQDSSPAAWERLVESLLASPEYGERWAQHWLDVARFGETHGYEYNVPREHAWRYRDWVIQALNADLPYDQFARMQIAGDALAEDRRAGAAAVGFLVAGVHNTVLGKSAAMRRASRHEELAEIAGVTAQTFLGLTVHCARCHDHKFDPIRQREYYEFIATLAGVRHGTRPVSQASGVSAGDLLRRQTELTAQLNRLAAARGVQLSSSANTLQTTGAIAANAKGARYRLTFLASPTVWGIKDQATTAEDGLWIRVVRPRDGSVVAERFFRPGSWQAAGRRQKFRPFRWDYHGDGSGDVRLQIGSNAATGRFGGAIDDLEWRAKDGSLLLREDFNQFKRPTNRALQADTRRTVYWGAKSPRWEDAGINTLHMVERASGKLAAQIFSGWQDKSFRPATDAERQLLTRRDRLRAQRTATPFFTVVSQPAEPMRILLRGDPKRLGAEVTPGGLSAIAGLKARFELGSHATDGDRRVRLAQWISHRTNGPFHRTLVNRIWHHHFGQGIVPTPNDLGFNGARPSHPQLLEWLATWFRDHRYSLKRLHRLIVCSATYQQRAQADSARAERIDGSNRLLWRQNPRRLEAEAVRDSLLWFADALNPQRFGPGYRDVAIERVGSAHYYRAIDPQGFAFQRRTIYRWRARGERGPLLECFDCPDPSATTPRRSVTTTAAQALSQWNDAFVLRMAQKLAARVQQDGGESLPAQVTHAWRRVLARDPERDELAAATQLARRHGLPLLCRVLLNCNEALVID